MDDAGIKIAIGETVTVILTASLQDLMINQAMEPEAIPVKALHTPITIKITDKPRRNRVKIRITNRDEVRGKGVLAIVVMRVDRKTRVRCVTHSKETSIVFAKG